MESKAKKCRTAILPVNGFLVRRDGHESPIEEHAALIYDRSNHVSGMAVVFHDLIESRVKAHKPTQPAEHDVLNHRANRLLSVNWLALAPTQSQPVDSGECQSLLPPAQHLWPSRVRIPAPRPLNWSGRTMLLQDLPAKMAHRILRSVTWTEVGSFHRATTSLRNLVIRAAALGRQYRI